MCGTELLGEGQVNFPIVNPDVILMTKNLPPRDEDDRNLQVSSSYRGKFYVLAYATEGLPQT